MRRLSIVALSLLLVSMPAVAQTATPLSKLAFDEVGQTVATASGATYTGLIDGSTTATPLTGIVCTATANPTGATCTSALPPLTPGTHTITITQTIGGASSAASAPLSFSLIVVVTPTNVRITP